MDNPTTPGTSLTAVIIGASTPGYSHGVHMGLRLRRITHQQQHPFRWDVRTLCGLDVDGLEPGSYSLQDLIETVEPDCADCLRDTHTLHTQLQDFGFRVPSVGTIPDTGDHEIRGCYSFDDPFTPWPDPWMAARYRQGQPVENWGGAPRSIGPVTDYVNGLTDRLDRWDSPFRPLSSGAHDHLTTVLLTCQSPAGTRHYHRVTYRNGELIMVDPATRGDLLGHLLGRGSDAGMFGYTRDSAGRMVLPEEGDPEAVLDLHWDSVVELARRIGLTEEEWSRVKNNMGATGYHIPDGWTADSAHIRVIQDPDLDPDLITVDQDGQRVVRLDRATGRATGAAEEAENGPTGPE